MKSKICFMLLLAVSSVIAQENVAQPETPHKVKQEYGYLSFGLGPFPILLPAFAGGYRAQSNHHGVDLSLQVQTVEFVTQLKANLLYLHYFKPDLCSEFYVGGGLGPSVLFGDDYCSDGGYYLHINTHVLLSPEFVFGKQYRNERNDLRFFQMQISFPTIGFMNRHSHDDLCKFPLVILSYGIGF